MTLGFRLVTVREISVSSGRGEKVDLKAEPKIDVNTIDLKSIGTQIDFGEFQRKILKEIEYKLAILTDGVSIEEEAMEGVGSLWKENINWLFDYSTDREVKPGTVPPEDCRLPMGTTVMINYNARSPHHIRKENGQLILEKNGRFLTTVEWLERPKYYSKLTSDGTPMQKVAPLFGDCDVCVNFVNRCMYFKTNDQCLFCNMNPTAEWHKEEVAARKLAKSVGEVVKAAFEEGINWHIVLTSGTLPANKVTELAVPYVEAIRVELGWDTVPGFLNPTVVRDLSEVDRVYKAGLRGLGHNLEVWHPDAFKMICPGKHKTIGRERWIEGLKYAVSVFGRGNVYSNLLMGLEPKESFLEGVQAQAEMGVFTPCHPWMVLPGSKLEGYRAPQVETMVELTSRAVDIMEKYLPEVFTPEIWSSGHTAGCDRGNLLCAQWQEIRRRTGFTLVQPNDVGKGRLVYIDRDHLIVSSPYVQIGKTA